MDVMHTEEPTANPANSPTCRYINYNNNNNNCIFYI